MLARRCGLSLATSPLQGAWLMHWYAARGALVGLTAACALETLRLRRLKRAVPRAGGQSLEVRSAQSMWFACFPSALTSPSICAEGCAAEGSSRSESLA